MAYSPDSTHIVTGGWDGEAIVWNATTGNQLTTLDGHTDSVLAVAYSPDSTRFVTGSSDGTAIVWDATAVGL